MKRLLLILSLVSFLALSHSARGEHSGEDIGFRTLQVPAIDKSQRLYELTNACLSQRPAPPLQYKTIEVAGDRILPTLPSVPSTSTPPSPGTGEGGGGGGGSSSDGAAIFENRCVACHSTPFSAGSVAEVARRTSLPANDNDHMPKGGAPLSEDERQALITFIQNQ